MILFLSYYLDMATPALARFGSDELKKQFLVPTIAGDVVACIGVSEAGAGSDVASIKTTAVPKKGEICVVIGPGGGGGGMGLRILTFYHPTS